MRKVLITALSLVMVGSVLLSAAGKGPGPKGGREDVQITGEITAIDSDTSQIIVNETTVQVTPETVVMVVGIPGDFNDLELGDIVKVRGKMVDDVLVADKINVKCDLWPKG